LSDRALIVLLAIIVTIASVATNLYIPALPAVRQYFGASVAEAQTTFSIALVTFAIGMLCWGPVADRYGRRRAILGGIAVMMVGTTMCLFAPSLGWLVAGRGVSAFGTATGVAVSRAVISDLFPAERMARMLAQLGIVAVVASGLSPILGGFLAAGFGWRSVFVALLATAGSVAWFTWRYLPETRSEDTQPPQAREMAAAAVRLLRTPLYLSCVLQQSMSFAAFVVFVSLAPYVMIIALGRPATEYGFYYLFIAVGYVLGNWGVGRFASRGQHWTIALGGTLQAVGALAALAFATLGRHHPLWIFVPMGMVYFGQGLFMPHLTAIAVSLAPSQVAGVGSSTLGFLNQLVAAVCVQVMGTYGTHTALPMLVFCAGAALLQLLVFRLSPRMESAGRGA
jgi:DHA1 family bicyclomycin/chloramphenicol resistance-like MFS transporter